MFRQLLVLAVLVSFFGCTRRGEVAFMRPSPGGKYQATVYGHLEAPHNLFVEHSIDVEIKNGSGELLAAWAVYSGDSLDRGFSAKFEAPEWVRENVLKFASARRPSVPGPAAEVRIENRSNEPLACIRVKTQDIFLALDLPPRSVVTLPSSAHPPAEVLFMSVARCDSRGDQTHAAMNFALSDPASGWRGRYIVVFDNRRFSLALDPPQSPLDR